MAKSNTARIIGEGPESDREVSGIRSRPATDLVGRVTAKVPKVDLERLLAEERELAETEELSASDLEDATIVMPPASRGPVSEVPPSQEATLRLQAPPLPAGVPSPLGSDFPPPVPELTAVLPYTPVSIPAPPSSFEALREARDDARQTKRLVVAIWAFALTLASGLGYFVASHG